MSNLEGPNEHDDLTRELRNRSHDVDGHPIGFDAIKRSARKIQWRRRVAGAAVATAVLAIAVPAGMAMSNSVTTGADPVDQPTPTTSSSPSPSRATPKTPSGSVELTTVGIPRGNDPAVPVLRGSTLTTANGPVTLPAAYTSITPLRGGWLANAFANGVYSVVELDAKNQVTSTQPGGDGFAVSQFGPVAYFVSDGPTKPGHLISALANGMSDGQSTLDTRAGAQVRPVGFLGAGTVVYQTYGTHPEVRTSAFDNKSALVPGALAAGGTSEALGRISVMTRSTGSGSCWAVVNAKGTPDWSTCAYSLGRFSPDGHYLIATDPYGDGNGATWVAILDARNGHQVARYDRARNGSLFIHALVWEDQDHVLGTVWEDGAWSIVRMDTNGGLQQASEKARADDTSWPFEFAATP